MRFDYYIKYAFRYSIKTIIRFIIRILILFGVIFLLSFLKGKNLLIANVNAETLTPKSITYNTSGGSITGGVSSGSFNDVPLSYYNYSSNTYTFSVSFNYQNLPNTLMNKRLNFSGVIYTTLNSNDLTEPLHVWVVDDNTGTSYACTTQSSSTRSSAQVSYISYWNTFNCSNVVITYSNFKIYIGSNFYSSGSIGIGKINFSPNSDDTINSSIKDTKDAVNDTNDTIKDDNVDSSTSQGQSFFDDFDSGDEGSLTDIVSLPLEYITHLNDSCKPFSIPTGYFGTINIPCLSTVWSTTSFTNVINIVSAIINGLICYRVLVNLFYFFKDLKDPDNDKVEVMDL